MPSNKDQMNTAYYDRHATELEYAAKLKLFEAANWRGDPKRVERTAEEARVAFQEHMDAIASAIEVAKRSVE